MEAAEVPNEPIDPAGVDDRARPVEVIPSTSTVRIRDLTIERPAIAAYLEHIAPDKLEIALVHALEVGITELAARRERFRK